MLLSIAGNGQRLQGFAPRGRSFDRDQGDLEILAALVIERPERRSCRVRVPVRHKFTVDAA
jgi:hypothetical protein